MTDRQGNSATMQGIRTLQSWNCVLEDRKVAKIIPLEIVISAGIRPCFSVAKSPF